MPEARWAWSSQYNGQETRARGYGWRYQANARFQNCKVSKRASAIQHQPDWTHRKPGYGHKLFVVTQTIILEVCESMPEMIYFLHVRFLRSAWSRNHAQEVYSPTARPGNGLQLAPRINWGKKQRQLP